MYGGVMLKENCMVEVNLIEKLVMNFDEKKMIVKIVVN